MKRTSVFFAVCIAVLVILGAVRISAQFSQNEPVTATGRQNLNFRVFYSENTIFGENPISSNLDFLMSYTDFIEIDNNFSANFSEEATVLFTYLAEKRLVVRPIGGGNIIFEEIFPLSDVRGESITDNFTLHSDTYRIEPQTYIERFLYFVQDQARQKAAANSIAQALRGFSAELHIDFTHTLRSSAGMNETVTSGLVMELTSEIYTLAATGTPDFAWTSGIPANETPITTGMVLLFSAAFLICVYGFLRSVKSHGSDTREEAAIFKKYENEIIMYDSSILSECRHVPLRVREFGELVKLALNLNKHIMCYSTDTYTEFVVIADDFAAFYEIGSKEKIAAKETVSL
ncbi:MAG: DUF5305 domain-containing protein [Defluviitaleaceae bacterium]|nr:DUF5305 domain-containing protein [Defluviitaleaceae bacterium]MCL2262386.1 DUF5305 domain-containing protein [Defluviitaleaceae bacterium]